MLVENQFRLVAKNRFGGGYEENGNEKRFFRFSINVFGNI